VQQLGCFAVSEIVETSPEHLSIKCHGALRRRGGRVRLNSVSVPIDGFPAVGLH
jgi:hypothetical protein